MEPLKIYKQSFYVNDIVNMLKNNKFLYEKTGRVDSKCFDLALMSRNSLDVLVAKNIDDGSSNYDYMIFGGHTLLRSFDYYIIQDLPFNDLEIYEQFNGKSFSEFPRSMQRRIEESEITCYIDNSYEASHEVIQKYAMMLRNIKD